MTLPFDMGRNPCRIGPPPPYEPITAECGELLE